MEEVFASVSEIIRQVTKDTVSPISATTVASDINGWDSISHIDIIVSVEQRFAIKFKIGELRRLKNVGELVAKTVENMNLKH
jgi:acyl carrier protein